MVKGRPALLNFRHGCLGDGAGGVESAVNHSPLALTSIRPAHGWTLETLWLPTCSYPFPAYLLQGGGVPLKTRAYWLLANSEFGSLNTKA